MTTKQTDTVQVDDRDATIAALRATNDRLWAAVADMISVMSGAVCKRTLRDVTPDTVRIMADSYEHVPGTILIATPPAQPTTPQLSPYAARMVAENGKARKP